MLEKRLGKSSKNFSQVMFFYGDASHGFRSSKEKQKQKTIQD